MPKDFNTETQLDSMEGVYLPFWNYDYAARVEIAGTGDRERTWYEGKYTVVETKTYAFRQSSDMSIKDITCYASTKLPEESVASITPFKEDQSLPFAMPYLSGYLTENYQTDALGAQGQATKQVQKLIDKEFIT